MDVIQEREHHISKGFVTLMKWIGIFMFGVSLLYLIFPFIDPPKNLLTGITIYVIGFIFFMGISIYCFYYIINKDRYSIRVTAAGLSSLGKSRTDVELRWEEISAVKERRYLQRLDVYGHNGRTILGVEYQLDDFELLRRLILSKASANSLIHLPFARSKHWVFHVYSMAFLGGVIYGGYYFYYIDREVWLVIGMAVFFGMLLAEYFRQVVELRVTAFDVFLRYPLNNKRIKWSEISDIQVLDEFVQGSRIPGVLIQLKDGTERKVKNMGVDAAYLFQILTHARERYGVHSS